VSDTPASSRKLGRGEGRDALIDAALEILVDGGLKAVTYRSVALRAGVTHGLVRYHFQSLDVLVHAAVHRAAQRSIRLTSLESEGGGLDGFAAGLVENVRTEPNQHAMMYELAMESLRRPELGVEMRTVYDNYISTVRAELDRVGITQDDDTLARVVFAALDGLVLQQLVFGRPGAAQEGIDRLRELIRAAGGAGTQAS